MNDRLPPNVTSQANPSALPESWVERLFLRFSAMYGSKFADLWRGCDLTSVKGLWAEELAGYSADEIKRGIDCCKTRDWPPTLPEFLKLCRPPVDFERAFVEAVKQISLRDSGRDEWSHPAIYWAAVEIGAFDLRNSSWSGIGKRWTAALSAQLAKQSWPPVPQRMAALPAPGEGAPRPERVAAIAKEAGIAMSLNGNFDPLLWAKKPAGQLAWNLVLNGARKHAGLADVAAQAIENGIANDAGVLLKRWDGNQWLACH